MSVCVCVRREDWHTHSCIYIYIYTCIHTHTAVADHGILLHLKFQGLRAQLRGAAGTGATRALLPGGTSETGSKRCRELSWQPKLERPNGPTWLWLKKPVPSLVSGNVDQHLRNPSCSILSQPHSASTTSPLPNGRHVSTRCQPNFCVPKLSTWNGFVWLSLGAAKVSLFQAVARKQAGQGKGRNAGATTQVSFLYPKGTRDLPPFMQHQVYPTWLGVGLLSRFHSGRTSHMAEFSRPGAGRATGHDPPVVNQRVSLEGILTE